MIMIILCRRSPWKAPHYKARTTTVYVCMLTAYIPTLALAAKGISFLYINKVTVPITQYPSPKFGSVKFWNTVHANPLTNEKILQHCYLACLVSYQLTHAFHYIAYNQPNGFYSCLTSPIRLLFCIEGTMSGEKHGVVLGLGNCAQFFFSHFCNPLSKSFHIEDCNK